MGEVFCPGGASAVGVRAVWRISSLEDLLLAWLRDTVYDERAEAFAYPNVTARARQIL